MFSRKKRKNTICRDWKAVLVPVQKGYFADLTLIVKKCLETSKWKAHVHFPMLFLLPIQVTWHLRVSFYQDKWFFSGDTNVYLITFFFGIGVCMCELLFICWIATADDKKYIMRSAQNNFSQFKRCNLCHFWMSSCFPCVDVSSLLHCLRVSICYPFRFPFYLFTREYIET